MNKLKKGLIILAAVVVAEKVIDTIGSVIIESKVEKLK